PEADSQKRHAALDGVNQRRAEMLFVEGANQGGVMTNSRKQQAFRLGNAFGRRRAVRFSTEALERVFHRRHIAGAVVEDGYFHSSRFVVGKSWRRPLLREAG